MYYQLHRTGKIYALFAVALIALPLITIMLKDISYFQRGYYNEFLLNPTCALTFPLLVFLWLLYSVFDLKRLHWKYNVQDRELILPVVHPAESVCTVRIAEHCLLCRLSAI